MAQKKKRKKWYRVLIQCDQPRKKKKFKCKKTKVCITLNLKIEEEYQKKKDFFLPELKSSVNNCFTRCTLRVERVMGALYYLIILCTALFAHYHRIKTKQSVTRSIRDCISRASLVELERKIKDEKKAINALASVDDRSLKNFTNFYFCICLFFFSFFSHRIRSFVRIVLSIQLNAYAVQRPTKRTPLPTRRPTKKNQNTQMSRTSCSTVTCAKSICGTQLHLKTTSRDALT